MTAQILHLRDYQSPEEQKVRAMGLEAVASALVDFSDEKQAAAFYAGLNTPEGDEFVGPDGDCA